MEISDLISEIEDTELVLTEAKNVYNLATNLFKQASRESNAYGMMVSDYYLAYYYVYYEKNMNKARQYATSCVEGATALNNDKYIMLSHFIKSSVNIAALEPYDAIDAIITSLKIARKYDNKFIISICHCNVGDIFSSIGDYKYALEYYDKAKNEADEYAIAKDLHYQKILLDQLCMNIMLKRYDHIDRTIKLALMLFEDSLALPFEVIKEISNLIKRIEYANSSYVDDIYEIMLHIDEIEAIGTKTRVLFLLSSLVMDSNDKGLYEEYSFMVMSYAKLTGDKMFLKQAHIIKNSLLGTNSSDDMFEYAELVDFENERLRMTVDKSIKRIIDLYRIEFERDNEIERNRKLEKLSNTDSLTNLYNRRYSEDRINQILNDVTKQSYAFIIIDVDKFKDINDTYGHSAGDQALVFISDTLKKAFKEDSIICRLGGDEFVVLLYNLPTQFEIRRSVVSYRIDELINILRETTLDFLDNQKMSVSLGVTLEDGTFDTLYSNADAALYSSKDGGRGIYTVFPDKAKIGNEA
ncbi:MAG: GGDEF domain-containing protein [Anaeroplasmataceae bacterium]